MCQRKRGGGGGGGDGLVSFNRNLRTNRSVLVISVCAVTSGILIVLLDITSFIVTSRAGAGLSGVLTSHINAESKSPIEWVQIEDVANETEWILRQIHWNASNACQGVSTANARVAGLPAPDSRGVIRLQTGVTHELTIISMAASGEQRCVGGDFYETDVSGTYWKSRPPVIDRGDGTYGMKLQMDSRYAGVYHFRVVLLFANFEGLQVLPIDAHNSLVRNQEIMSVKIEFGLTPSSNVAPADLKQCRADDFSRKQWSGRWTREFYNESCEVGPGGRFLCLNQTLQCEPPWCQGPVGRLESNGWVYSAHCSFKIFTEDEAWQCLDGKWLFFWGDSTNLDTARNLLNLVLGLSTTMDRRVDRMHYRHSNHATTMRTKPEFISRHRRRLSREGSRETKLSGKNNHPISGPNSSGQSVRVTHFFNGNANVHLNYQGLAAMKDHTYRNQLRSYFSKDSSPDYMIMNSGLHDAIYPGSIDEFVNEGVPNANQFWKSVLESVLPKRPMFIHRNTVTVAGTSRDKGFNPQKIDMLNRLYAEKVQKLNLPDMRIVDFFDLTFPFHWDNDCADGPHYGRLPVKAPWVNGKLGHHYFVDLMMAHILLNSMCNT